MRRSHLLKSIRDRLERQQSPRLQMLLMVSGAGVLGFLTDWLLLRALGVVSMALRYGLSVGLSYLGFVGLLRLWISTQQSSDELGALDASDAVALAELGEDAGYVAAGSIYSGRGGSSSSSDSGDLEEGTLIAFLLAAVAGLFLAAGWLIVQAPAILAELALDCVLTAGLYRRLRRADQSNWLSTTFRLTSIPFLIVLVLMIAAGWALQKYAPEARTLHEVWMHGGARSSRAPSSDALLGIGSPPPREIKALSGL